MRKLTIITLGLLLLLAAAASAGNLPVTQVTQILEHKSSLELSDSQIKRLEIISKNAVEEMIEAKGQANIRLMEIEKFTSNWTNLNGTAVRGLIKEYYKFMAEYKSAEVNAILQARAILSYEQLTKFQQLASIETLMIDMETRLTMN